MTTSTINVKKDRMRSLSELNVMSQEWVNNH